VQPFRVNPSPLSIIFGVDDAAFRQSGQKIPVAWSEDSAINGHMLVAGKSGSGKTFTLKRIVGQIVRSQKRIRVHAFDVHSDLSFSDESHVLFSESTHYGINPLKISAHPHYGGVRKRVQSFIQMVNDSSRELGPRQTATLRAILYDLYEMSGFKLQDPDTWSAASEQALPPGIDPSRIYLDIPFDEKDRAKEVARASGAILTFDSQAKCWYCDRHEGGLTRWPRKFFGKKYPTLPDAARFAANRLRALYTGGGSKAMRLLEEHNRKVNVWHNKCRKLAAGSAGPDGIEALREEVQESAIALSESFQEYVLNIETGKELDNLIRFDTADTMRSLVERLESLVATGIFRVMEPPFEDDKPVWRYGLGPLGESEQQMFVWTKLTQIFDEARELGPVKGASELRDVIIIDEAHKFFRDKEDNILNTLAKEARKFGIALICASQSPSHFSEDFLSNVGTKILLGLDQMYHDQTVRKMKIDPKILDFIVPTKVVAIQVASRSEQKPRFIQTRVAA
jgi:hypothetical protein